MNAIILSIGDELVLGQTVDTNSAWISQQLAAVGCGVNAHLTVGDDHDEVPARLSSCGRPSAFIRSALLGDDVDGLCHRLS